MATCSQFSVGKSCEAVMDYICSTCEEKTIQKCADFYCEECKRFYCGKCIHYHDQVFIKHTACERGEIRKWPVSQKVEDLLQKCDVHQDKILELFCNDHSQLCCTNCAFLNHRLCVKVALISESVQNQSIDLQELSLKIQTILEQMKNLQNNRQASVRSLQGAYNEHERYMIDEMQLDINFEWDNITLKTTHKNERYKEEEICLKINSILQEFENSTVKKMKDELLSLQATVKSAFSNCIKLQDELKRLHEAIPEIRDKGKGDLSFIASKKLHDKIQQCDTYLKENYVQVGSSLTFQANNDIEQYLIKLSILGRTAQSTQTLTVNGNPDHVFTVKEKSAYDVTISSDLSIIYITAICFLPNYQILVADNNNKTVKLLDQQYQVVSHCDVPATPFDMCRITTSWVAVTVDYNDDYTYEVLFISFNNGQLVKGRKLQLKHTCRGIAHHKGDLYVTSCTALYKYTLRGQLVNKLYEDTSDPCTVYMCAVSPTGDNIYVTTTPRYKLITLARDGSVMSTFTDPELQGPLSVDVTPGGQVLVCGYWSHNIIQVDSEGRKKLATLATVNDGVLKPWSVCFNRNTATIIVGQEAKTILVFKTHLSDSMHL